MQVRRSRVVLSTKRVNWNNEYDIPVHKVLKSTILSTRNNNMVKRIWVHRWMPRSREAKKAVVSCEKPGVGAHIRQSSDSRMG